MTPDFVSAYLLNAAWQIPLVALVAVVVSRFSGLSARVCNKVWLGFLGAAALLPAVSLDGLLPRAAVTVARIRPNAPVEPAPPTLPPLPSADAPALQLAPWMAWTMAGACAVVGLLLVARLIVAALAARRLVRGATPIAVPAEVLQAVQQLAEAHGRAAPPILSTSAVAGPAVVGVFRPVILTPPHLTEDRTELRAALLHEMAHVVRHDYAVNLACELLTLPVSWHPALLALKTGVRRSRELACDAIAAEAMASRKTYARCLVSLAQSLGAQSLGAPRLDASRPSATRHALAVGLFGRSDLEDRLMQLMKSREAEGPLVTAARLGGLAAVSAGLLGSLALLHVTPVFAQAAPARAAASAAPTAAAAASAGQAERDAGPAAPHHRSGAVYSNHGAIISTGRASHTHAWTTATGQPITIINDDPSEFTPEQRARWEAEAREAEAKGARAEAMVNSPEFKARIAEAERRGAEAEKLVNSPAFKARIAEAERRGAEAEKLVNSPEFKARVAEAERRGAEAEKMVNSAEFKARIAEAQARGAEAERRVHSPEFRAQLERARVDVQAAGVRLQRELDDLRAQDERATPRTTP